MAIQKLERRYFHQIHTSELTGTSYINFGFGDEGNEDVYDTSIARLRRLEAQYDPHNVFNQWFDIRT